MSRTRTRRQRQTQAERHVGASYCNQTAHDVQLTRSNTSSNVKLLYKHLLFWDQQTTVLSNCSLPRNVYSVGMLHWFWCVFLALFVNILKLVVINNDAWQKCIYGILHLFNNFCPLLSILSLSFYFSCTT